MEMLPDVASWQMCVNVAKEIHCIMTCCLPGGNWPGMGGHLSHALLPPDHGALTSKHFEWKWPGWAKLLGSGDSDCSFLWEIVVSFSVQSNIQGVTIYMCDSGKIILQTSVIFSDFYSCDICPSVFFVVTEKERERESPQITDPLLQLISLQKATGSSHGTWAARWQM